MKNAFNLLKIIIGIIATLVFIAGVILTVVGAYDIVVLFTHVNFGDQKHLGGVIGIGLLSAVDLFLIAIVFFVLSLGIILLFSDAEKPFPVNLPEWLRLKNFMQLKTILWETILTTLVIGHLSWLAGKRFRNEEITLDSLIVPGGIFLIAFSLYFLKKEKEE